jgi:hypothetical protein
VSQSRARRGIYQAVFPATNVAKRGFSGNSFEPGSQPLTLRWILVILIRFARTSRFVCLNPRDVTDARPAVLKWFGQGPRARRSSGRPHRFRKLFSCKGRNTRKIPGKNRVETPRERIDRLNRYGARAFSTSEGYASRNRETELASLEFDIRGIRTATVAVLV